MEQALVLDFSLESGLCEKACRDRISWAGLAVWHLTAECWRQPTLLPALTTSLLKLTFQLIARYCTWLRSISKRATGPETLCAVARAMIHGEQVATKCELCIY